MPITARFEADFEQFNGATKTADTSLLRLVDSSKRVATNLDQFGVVSAKGASGTKGWTTELTQFDSVLSSVGLHIGPEIRGLGEIGDAAGKSAKDLGALATAGLAFGAAIGGWKIGRLISDFFDLDDAIGKATSKVLGLGDIAAQEAGAGMDVLTRATQIAGHEVTNFAEAQKIIIDANGKFAASMNTSEFRVSQWHAELAKVQGEGKLESLRLAVLSHNSTMEELSKQYGISTRALEFFKRQLTDTAAAHEKDTATMAAATLKMSAATERLNQLGGGWKTTLASIEPVTKAAIQNYLALGATTGDLAIKYGLSEIAIQAVSKGMTEQTQIMALTEPALGSLDEWIKTAAKDTADWNLGLRFTSEVIGDKLAPEIDAVIPKIEALAAAGDNWNKVQRGAVEIQMGPVDFSQGGGREAAMREYTAAMGGSSLGGFGGPRAEDFTAWALSHNKARMMAVGGPTTEGPAYLHEGEYVVPKGGALVRGGGGVPPVIITVNGNVIGADLSRLVEDGVRQALMQSTKLAS